MAVRKLVLSSSVQADVSRDRIFVMALSIMSKTAWGSLGSFFCGVVFPFCWGLRQKSRHINIKSIDRIDYPPYNLYAV